MSITFLYIGIYVTSYLIISFSFQSLYLIDRCEYLMDKQKTIYKFKRKKFFVINYTKNKKEVAKKTFILEVMGYCIMIFLTIFFVLVLLFYYLIKVSLILTIIVKVLFHIGFFCLIIYDGTITSMYKNLPFGYY